MRRLIGVGVGPGDPELVTVKAVRLLRESDVVLVPVLDERGQPVQVGAREAEPDHGAGGEGQSSAGVGRAEATVRAYVDSTRVRRVAFACGDRGGLTERRTAAWARAAAAVREHFDHGAEMVAFATIGDPNAYSTFSYLARTVRDLVPDSSVETTPGVVAMQDLAARSGTVLVEGTESLTLVPLTGGAERFREALDFGDTVVAYKCGDRMPEARAALEKAGRLGGAAYGAMLGLPGEDVRPVRELSPDERTPYLSTVVSPGERLRRGGRLP